MYDGRDSTTVIACCDIQYDVSGNAWVSYDLFADGDVPVDGITRCYFKGTPKAKLSKRAKFWSIRNICGEICVGEHRSTALFNSMLNKTPQKRVIQCS